MQLVLYIKQNLDSGYSEQSLRQALLTQGWQQAQVDQAFQAVYASQPAPTQPANMQPSTPQDKNRVRNGVLWILSPFIIFTVNIVLSLFVRIIGIDFALINIAMILLGLLGFIMLFVGPTVGVIKLASKK